MVSAPGHRSHTAAPRPDKSPLTARALVKQFNAIVITIAFKATEDLNDFIRSQATAKNTTISDFIRGTFEAMRPRKRCKITGRPGRVVIVPPPGTPPLTSEMIKAEMERMDDEYLMSKAL